MKLKVIIITLMSVAAGWVDKLLFTVARVARTQDINEQFRILTLEGSALTQNGFAPGDKIQVRAAALALRTYTPVDWDRAQGRVRLFAFLHGHGPWSTLGSDRTIGRRLLVLGTTEICGPG